MKNTIIKNVLLVLALCLFGQFALAHGDAAKELASIVSNVAHSPSDEQKAALMAIANKKKNSTAIKTLAKVTYDLQHSVTAESKAKLDAIIADATATASEKELATIITGFNHTFSDDAKTRLANIK